MFTNEELCWLYFIILAVVLQIILTIRTICKDTWEDK